MRAALRQDTPGPRRRLLVPEPPLSTSPSRALAIRLQLESPSIGDKGPSASSISEEVGKNVAAVLRTALSENKKPTFNASSLREHSLANAEAILNLYNNDFERHITGFLLTITDTGEQIEASLIAKGDSSSLISRRLGTLIIIQGQ
ncbi:hypothetical protein MBLNU13_g10952t1 [Cladosporium sp. NU13]